VSHEYDVKDSGKRMSFASGMVRDLTEGKIKWHLIRSGPMYKRWAVHLTKGAVKYGDDNWLKANGPEELKRFKESADRHFNQWIAGETDEDHAAAVMFNINGAEYVMERMAEIAAKRDTVRIEEDEARRAERESWETPEQRKRRLWKEAGRPYADECTGAKGSDKDGYWVCELPDGHTGKHSAPGYCEDW